MSLVRHSRRNVLVSSVLVLAALPSSAHAQTVTRFATFMHSGPGRQFAVTDEIPTQTPLAPNDCQSGWCRIRYGNADGWVEQSTLVNGPATAQPKPGERPTECMDFARSGWPDSGNLERVCVFPAQKTP